VTVFSRLVDEFLAEHFRLDPVDATATGMHAHDASWPDLSEAGERALLEHLVRWERTFGELRDPDLGPDERIDRDQLLLELEAMRFAVVELRQDRWDPLSIVYLLGEGLFLLLAREFAPLADRLRSVAGRLEGIPGLLLAAGSRLGTDPDRPVSRFHAETALAQLGGITDLAHDALAQAEAAAGADVPAAGAAVPAALVDRIRTATAAAAGALAAFEAHLRDVVLPAAEGEGRLGPDLFARKMRRSLMSPSPAPDEILERAEREFAAVRREMVAIARRIWPAWLPDRPLPDASGGGGAEAAEDRIVRDVLAAVAGEHQPADRLPEFCREEVARIETFCRDHDVVGLASEPLSIEWTPVFLRAFAKAMLIAPGPLDRGEKTFFAITPIADDATPEEAESSLREDNDRMLRVMTIHEAVPGHYLQLAWSNRCPSLVRSVFQSGVFAEGWAVYVEQVLMDLGYGADDPALLLTHWKLYLRAVINAIVDVRVHTRDMAEAEAIDLMVRGGFQEEAEARAKYGRARLSSTQLSTYFVGSMGMWDLERERRRRLAAASGDPRGAAAVPEPRVVGGFGETPGFVYREHLEEVLSHGSPPLPILRRLVLGDQA